MAQDEVLALAEQLGWTAAQPLAPSLREALGALLDDECERLGPAAWAALSALPDPPGSRDRVERCPSCGLSFLARYHPDDGRCRCCAALLNGAAATERGPPSPPGDPALRLGDLEVATWSLAGSLTLPRPFPLPPELDESVPLVPPPAPRTAGEEGPPAPGADDLSALDASLSDAELRRRFPGVEPTRVRELVAQAEARVRGRLEESRRQRRINRRRRD